MAAEEGLERLSAILGTVNSGYEGHARMMAKAQLEEEAFIKKLARLNNTTESTIKRELDQAAAKIASDRKQQQQEELREKAIAEGVKKSISGLQQLFGGATSASQAAYNSDAAFTAFIPTLNLLGDTVKTIIGALASFTSGLPFIGGFFSAVDKLAVAAVDLTTKVVSAQLENVQKMVNDYNAISKSGMTFGGNLDKMTAMATTAGMSLGSFSKFISNNIESLSKFGGGILGSTEKVAKLTGAIANENKALLAIYGSYEGLASATADYGSMLAGVGIDAVKTGKMEQKAVEEYLIAQKELTALTGKSGATLKKEEEERRKSAAYQMRIMALQKSNPEAYENVRRNITMFGEISEDAAKYAQEFFSNEGQIISRQSLFYQQQFPDLAEAIQKTQRDALTQNNAEFVKNQSSYLQTVIPLAAEAAKAYDNLYRLNAGQVKNEYIDSLSKNASGLLAASTNFAHLVEVVNKQQQDRIDMEKGKKTNLVGGAIGDLEGFKVVMDGITVKALPQMAAITKSLSDIQTAIASAFGSPDMINKLTVKATKLFADILKEINPKPGDSAVAAGLNRETNTDSGSGVNDQSNLGKLSNNIDANTTAIRESNTWWDRWNNLLRMNEAGRTGAGNVASGNLVPNTAGTSLIIPQKGNEYTERSKPNEKLTLALNSIYEKFGKPSNWQVTAGNDLEHTKGDHPKGLAADIKVRGAETHAQVDAIAKEINAKARAAGIKGTAEAHEDTDLSTGKGTGKFHLHYKLSPEELLSMIIDGQVQERADRVAQLDESRQMNASLDKLLRVMS